MINPLAAIKTFFTFERVTTDIKQEATKMSGTTPGWKTSEFWLSLAAQAATLWGAVQGFIPPKYAAIVSTVGVAVYTVARTILKAITDVKSQTATNPVAVSTTSTTTVAQ
jgi:hypothetical protein